MPVIMIENMFENNFTYITLYFCCYLKTYINATSVFLFIFLAFFSPAASHKEKAILLSPRKLANKEDKQMLLAKVTVFFLKVSRYIEQ